jgi:hypothetical protein
MMKHISKALIFLMGLSFMTPSIAAGPSEPDGLRDIASCRGISKSKARLRCFDRATKFLDEAPERVAQVQRTESEGGKGTISVVAALPAEAPPPASYDAEEVDPDASFGAENLVKKDGRERKKELRAVTVSITTNKIGKYTVVLDNGQVWRQLQGDSNKLRVRRGAESGQGVIIKRRAMGAYALRLTNAKTSILVRRVK